jgi:hypothetical protein
MHTLFDFYTLPNLMISFSCFLFLKINLIVLYLEITKILSDTFKENVLRRLI